MNSMSTGVLNNIRLWLWVLDRASLVQDDSNTHLLPNSFSTSASFSST